MQDDQYHRSVMSFQERYVEAFWPLAALPLVLGGVIVAVALQPSVVAVGALAVLAIDVALGEVIIWRGLRAKWSGERDSLWPWSQRLRTWLEVLAIFAVMVAVGSWKAHDIQEGTWPEAVLFSALCFGGLSTFILVVAAVERAFNRTR